MTGGEPGPGGLRRGYRAGILRLMEADGLEEIETGDGRAGAGDYGQLERRKPGVHAQPALVAAGGLPVEGER